MVKHADSKKKKIKKKYENKKEKEKKRYVYLNKLMALRK